ncbi:RdgB/HAM1 family non-canonical purine NTP pyrophosphatase [uncultured Fibrobacter sp.]|uniref:RdgB/HAM1 family non-canonical purine NTP pyrophosphatase n=1 Tax=uncultured Fibrobacter sp. TaxID=261512 RepID=UPI0026128F80|nr:RdgB/HAM1 family non-canonical purine NTP pyrophosphatase [uncultured Fibrobacter sp.]
MKRLFIIATGNPGKIRDFAHILGTENNEFKTLKDIGFEEDIVEDGDSFEANAIIKSNTVAHWLADKKIEATVLADDSGLEVFALNGEPGIYSARYCGYHGNDQANNDKLMQKLQNVTDRSARYFCALSYQTVTQDAPGNFVVSKPKIYEGECRGQITHVPAGDMGFGYDPLFVPDGFDRTFAQMELSEKKGISHRGNAIRAMKKDLG